MNKRITISSEVKFQEVSGKVILLDLKNESYFGLNEVGTRVWQLLQKMDDETSIIDTMQHEYDVEPEQLKGELNKLLGKLAELELISLDAAER